MLSTLWSVKVHVLCSKDSLIPRVSPQKRGEEIFTGKAVDFRRVIIHMLNVGRSHFSNNCHAISVLYLVVVQAINDFAPRLQGISSCVEFYDTFSTCKLRAAKYGE